MATATKTYSVTCTCGDKLQVEARGRAEAVERMRGSLDELSMANHAVEKHPAGDAPTIEEMQDIIEATVVAD